MLPPSGFFSVWLVACYIVNKTKESESLPTQIYLYGLSKASLPQHFSVDEVRWAEDTVSPVWDNPKWLRPIDVLPLGDWWRSIAGSRRLISAVTSPKREENKEINLFIKEGVHTLLTGRWEHTLSPLLLFVANCDKSILAAALMSYVMMRDFRLLMSGLGGWVMGRMGLGPSDSGVDNGPSTWSSASEEPPSCPDWLWGSCSMVSCSSRLVSWISRSICRGRDRSDRMVRSKSERH